MPFFSFVTFIFGPSRFSHRRVNSLKVYPVNGPVTLLDRRRYEGCRKETDRSNELVEWSGLLD